MCLFFCEPTGTSLVSCACGRLCTWRPGNALKSSQQANGAWSTSNKSKCRGRSLRLSPTNGSRLWRVRRVHVLVCFRFTSMSTIPSRIYPHGVQVHHDIHSSSLTFLFDRLYAWKAIAIPSSFTFTLSFFLLLIKPTTTTTTACTGKPEKYYPDKLRNPVLCYSAMISSTFIVTVAVAIISIYIFKAFLSDPAPYGKVQFHICIVLK